MDFTEASFFALVPGICSIHRWQNISVVVWAGQATGYAVRKCSLITPHLRRDHPRGHSHASIVLSDTPPPNSEAQAALTAAMENPSADIVCHGVVVESIGFQASALKSQLTRANLNSKRDRRFALHASIEDLAQWMATPHSERTGVVVDAMELEGLLKHLRSQAIDQLGIAAHKEH